MEEPLLTPETYAVLRVVPLKWMDEQIVVEEIAKAQHQTKAAVSQRIRTLRRHRLLERRECPNHGFRHEVRKIAKEE